MLLRAVDRPFRITGIFGPLSGDPDALLPAEAKQLHRVDLALDPALVGEGGAADLRFSTDHPDQSTVPVSVLVLSDGQEDPE